MLSRSMLGIVAVAALTAAALALALPGARAYDKSKYPDWSGQWRRIPSQGRDPGQPVMIRANPPAEHRNRH